MFREERRPPSAGNAAPGQVEKRLSSDGFDPTGVLEFTSAADEEAANRRKEAALLLAVLPPGSLRVAGDGSSRIPAEAAGDPDERRLKRLDDLAGKNGTKNVELRLFLKDWADFRSAVGIEGDAFPFKAADAEPLVEWLAENRTAAAVNRVSSALAYATLLGLEVETDDSMSGASRATKKRRGASTARDAAPPYAFLAVDAAARGLRVTDVIAGERLAPGAASKPAVVAAQVIQVASLEASRGRDSHASHVLAPVTGDPDKPPGVFHTVNNEDKMGREEVEQWAPAFSFVTGESLEWAPVYIDTLAGLKFMMPDWAAPATGHDNVLNATAFAASARDGGLKFCAKKRALAQVPLVIAEAMGVSVAWLKERSLSGTHLWRKAGGKIAELALWEEPDGCCIGDWAAPGAGDGAPARPPRAGKGKKPAPSTRKKHYTPGCDRRMQIAVRERYVGLVSTAFREYGLANITLETTWEELLPEEPSAALAPFYGPRVVLKPRAAKVTSPASAIGEAGRPSSAALAPTGGTPRAKRDGAAARRAGQATAQAAKRARKA
jgi:hypothetical protein